MQRLSRDLQALSKGKGLMFDHTGILSMMPEECRRGLMRPCRFLTLRLVKTASCPSAEQGGVLFLFLRRINVQTNGTIRADLTE